MASHISQEYYDEMCLRFNLKDCHVSVNQLSRKKMAKKLKELIARCQAELEAGQEQQANQEPADVQPVDHQEDQVQPYPMVEIEEEEPEPEQMTVEKGKKEQQAVRRGGKRSVKQSIPDPASSDDAFSDYSHDNYPKSSPESFGSEPVVILPADHHHKPVLAEVFSGTEDGKENESSNHRKVQKEAEKPPPPPPLSLSLKSPGEAPTRRPSTLNETGYFFINRPSRTSPDFDTYFMQKYDVNPDAQVELDQLDPVFIEQAKAGLVKWKSYFKNPALELARLQAAAEPEDDPEYVEEEDDEIDVDEFLDEDEEEGSDFEKELVAITRSQEATLKRERFSPTEQQTSAKGKRGRKRQPSGTQKKEGGDEKEEEEDGVPEPKVKKQRKSRIVMHKCNDCNYTTSCIKDLKLHRAKVRGD